MDSTAEPEDMRPVSRVKLPPIQHGSLDSNRGSDKVVVSGNLEQRVRRLEDSNLRLLEIVVQLKNSVEDVLNSKLQQSDKISEMDKHHQMLSSQLDLVPHSEAVNFAQEGQTRMQGAVMLLTEELTRIKEQLSQQNQYLAVSANQMSSKMRQLNMDYLNKLELITDRVSDAQVKARQFVDCTAIHNDFSENINILRQEIHKLNERLDNQNSAQAGTEANLAFRVTEIGQKLNNEIRLRESEIRRLEQIQQDTRQMHESTRMVLSNQLDGMLSESQARLLDRETLTRTDLMQKMNDFERILLSERDTRSQREKEIHARISEVTEKATSYQNDSISQMREALQKNSSRTAEAVHQVESGLRLIEQNIDEKMRKYYQVTSAEVAARKRLQQSTQGDVEVLEEKIRATTAAMQLAVSGLANRIRNQTDLDQIKQQMDRRIGDFQLYMSRNMTDIDSQLQQMSNQIGAVTVDVEGRIAQATSELANEVRDTLSSVLTWQANSSAHLREMQNIRVSIMQELAKMQMTLNHIESEIPAQVTMETDERVNAIADIRHQMESLKIAVSTQPAVKEVDIDKIQESIRKLAETLQTMKSSVGIKIQSEQEMRMKQIADLQTELRYLEEQFVQKHKNDELAVETEQFGYQKKYFIGPSENDLLDQWNHYAAGFEALNRWSMYTTWRWLKLKKQLIIWKENAKKNKKNNKKKAPKKKGNK